MNLRWHLGTMARICVSNCDKTSSHSHTNPALFSCQSQLTWPNYGWLVAVFMVFAACLKILHM